MKRVKTIVCFGGGNAMPKAVLEGLKKEKGVKITSVATMFDSGGSSGKLREEFNVLPPGDIRRHILALSEAPDWKKELWEWRFNSLGDVEVKPQPSQDRHKGHNFGNVFLAGLEYILRDYKKVLEVVHDFMELRHRALPITIDRTDLVAELEDGTIIEGEDEIDVPQKHNPNFKIKKLFLKPRVKIFPETKKAILNADLITIGPGDLYSSIIACFLPEGVKDALRKSRAKKIFICPPLTKLGETNNFSVLDFSNEIEKYLGFPLDYVIYNTEIPAQKRLNDYKRKEKSFLDLVYPVKPPVKCRLAAISPKAKLFNRVKINKDLNKKKFLGRNLLVKSCPIIYDSKKVAKIILGR